MRRTPLAILTTLILIPITKLPISGWGWGVLERGFVGGGAIRAGQLLLEDGFGPGRVEGRGRERLLDEPVQRLLGAVDGALLGRGRRRLRDRCGRLLREGARVPRLVQPFGRETI